MPTYLGSCLCSTVAFEIVGEFNGFFFCHCSRCRKSSGSAHGANLFSQSAQFTWTKGEKEVRTFRYPDTRFARSFCPSCGSALPTVSEERIVVPAGSLDSDVDVPPTAHICMSSRANWDKELDSVVKFDMFPK